MSLINPKKPADILTRLLRDRFIPGSIFYDRKRHQWMHDHNGPQTLGTFYQAIAMITGGTLDFIARHHEMELIEGARSRGNAAGFAGEPYKNEYRANESARTNKFHDAWAVGYDQGAKARESLELT